MTGTFLDTYDWKPSKIFNLKSFIKNDIIYMIYGGQGYYDSI